MWLSWPQIYRDQIEYLEESWKAEETWFNSNYSIDSQLRLVWKTSEE